MVNNDPNSAIFHLLKTVDQQGLKLDSIRNDLSDIRVKIALMESKGQIVEPDEHKKIMQKAGVAGGGVAASVFTIIFAVLKYFGIQV